MISLIFWSLAATCNAVMDVLQNHWIQSIFYKRVKSSWWDPSVSWKNKYYEGDFRYGRNNKLIIKYNITH